MSPLSGCWFISQNLAQPMPRCKENDCAGTATEKGPGIKHGASSAD